MEQQELTKEQLEAMVVRQSKLNGRLQAEIGSLISMGLEQRIIIEELQEALQPQEEQEAAEVLTPEVME